MHPCTRVLAILTVCLTAGSIELSAQEQQGKPLDIQNKQHASAGRLINRKAYVEKLYGFWLGTCIANWTGLITEMDKVGNIGDVKTGPFYTRSNWGGPDQPNIWDKNKPSRLSPTIDFIFAAPDSSWGADDDTDIEYIYQELLLRHQTSVLTGEQIREGWLRHIRAEEENFLWVSNQRAFDLMKQGMRPPATGDPKHNPDFEMIDAQLTTEIFGLYAPTRPDIGLRMATLPIQATARNESEWISRFYVSMFSLAYTENEQIRIGMRLRQIADEARKGLPENSYPAAMYDYVKSLHASGIPWEAARDSIYVRYQVNQRDGYTLTARGITCNACFAAGINFASSLISLFYGDGDLKETIKIGTLAGWDSDNPTATWGGLIGFMLGKEGVEKAFGRKFSNRFHIHRTRTGFENGMDTFENMAEKGIRIIDRVVKEQMGGIVDLKENRWVLPAR